MLGVIHSGGSGPESSFDIGSSQCEFLTVFIFVEIIAFGSDVDGLISLILVAECEREQCACHHGSGVVVDVDVDLRVA